MGKKCYCDIYMSTFHGQQKSKEDPDTMKCIIRFSIAFNLHPDYN